MRLEDFEIWKKTALGSSVKKSKTIVSKLDNVQAVDDESVYVTPQLSARRDIE